MNDKRIDKIEMTLMHQDKQIDDLSEMIAKQWQEIDRLHKIMQKAEEKLSAISHENIEGERGSVLDIAAEDKPPHY